MNTKTKKARTKLYTDTMVTRVPPQMKEKFEILCQAEYKSASEVIRSFIYEYVRTRDASLNIIALHGQPQNKPKQRPAHEYDIRQPTSSRPPSQQDNENWDDWG